MFFFFENYELFIINEIFWKINNFIFWIIVFKWMFLGRESSMWSIEKWVGNKKVYCSYNKVGEWFFFNVYR